MQLPRCDVDTAAKKAASLLSRLIAADWQLLALADRKASIWKNTVEYSDLSNDAFTLLAFPFPHSPPCPAVISERSLLCYGPSVSLSSVTFVHPTQAVQIFGNISTALGTLAIR